MIGSVKEVGAVKRDIVLEVEVQNALLTYNVEETSAVKTEYVFQ